jgi:hypothetical protein
MLTTYLGGSKSCLAAGPFRGGNLATEPIFAKKLPAKIFDSFFKLTPRNREKRGQEKKPPALSVLYPT